MLHCIMHDVVQSGFEFAPIQYILYTSILTTINFVEIFTATVILFVENKLDIIMIRLIMFHTPFSPNGTIPDIRSHFYICNINIYT